MVKLSTPHFPVWRIMVMTTYFYWVFNISWLSVLTLGLERTNLLKENRIQAELPFPEQTSPFKCGTKWVCCCQLSVFQCCLCTEDLCLFLTQGCTGLWRDHTLTCTSLLSCNKRKKVGWLQVVWNKASSSLYWSLGWRHLISVCKLEEPQVSLLCITDIFSVSAGATSKATR